MKTLISNKIHNIIDFDSNLIDSSVMERAAYPSRRGSLNILGHFNTNAKSKTTYRGRILVGDNISYE